MADTKLSELKDAVPGDALKDAGNKLVSLLVQRAAEAATDRVSSLTDRLDGVAENGGTGLRSALGLGDRDAESGSDEDQDDGGGSGGGVLSGLKDKVTGLFGAGESGGGGGRSGSGKRLKVTNIVEEQDIGLPLRTCYDLWTQLGDFPSFMKKLESVEQESDEKTHWKAQVFLSHREWEATTLEQVPDSHIVWRSKGAKGHVDGAVTFTELGPNLTRVLLVLEYWPQGLFERTGNIWRAQGRRARLEFKHFRRHAMASALLHPEEIEGWRGEIRDGEVVKTHEEALEEEQRAGGEADGGQDTEDTEAHDDAEYGDEERGAASDSGEDGYDEAEDSDEGEYTDEGGDEGADGYADEDYADEGAEDEGAEDYADEDAEDEGAEDYADEDYEDTEDDADAMDEAEDADEPEDTDEEPAPRRRRGARRQPAGAGGRSR